MASVSTAATPSSTNTARLARRGGSSASRAGDRTSGRPKTARGIMTLESSPQGPRFRLHAAKREQLEASRKLLDALAMSLPESSPECERASAAAANIRDLLTAFTWIGLPSDRAENQLPVGDRT
jgi:hypothetical protein